MVPIRSNEKVILFKMTGEGFIYLTEMSARCDVKSIQNLIRKHSNKDQSLGPDLQCRHRIHTKPGHASFTCRSFRCTNDTSILQQWRLEATHLRPPSDWRNTAFSILLCQLQVIAETLLLLARAAGCPNFYLKSMIMDLRIREYKPGWLAAYQYF